MQGQLHGLMFANLWAGMFTGGRVLSSLFLGAGEVDVSGMMQLAMIFIGQQPAIAFLLSEATEFARLKKYSKSDG